MFVYFVEDPPGTPCGLQGGFLGPTLGTLALIITSWWALHYRQTEPPKPSPNQGPKPQTPGGDITKKVCDIQN